MRLLPIEPLSDSPHAHSMPLGRKRKNQNKNPPYFSSTKMETLETLSCSSQHKGRVCVHTADFLCVCTLVEVQGIISTAAPGRAL